MIVNVLQDPATNKYYVFVNEGDIYTNADGSEYSYVTVIDTLIGEVRQPAHAHIMRITFSTS